MADHVVAGLVKRRAELAGEADALRTRLAQIGTDLGHLDATIRLFDPEHDIVGIRPKRPRAPDVAGRGEMTRAILAVLREAAEPVTVAAISERLMAQRGWDTANGKRARMMAKRVAMVLRHQERRGAVQVVQEPGRAAAWEVGG
jgi:hypothetical protein